MSVVKKASVADARDSDKVPKYVAIKNWLIDRIANGEFARGEQLPSEHDVMAQFSVSRVTARQAFDDLRALGMVEAKRGKGYFVNRLLATASLERLQSFGEMMAGLGVETHSNILELSETQCDAATAQGLGVPIGTVVTNIARSRIAGGTTVSVDLGALPLEIGRKLMLLDLGRNDIFLLMEQRLGLEIGFADLTLDVAEVPAEIRHALGVGASEQVLRLKRRTFSNSGTVLMFEYIYARLDRLQFRVRIPRW
jgi:GntR family transcriptional regulator